MKNIWFIRHGESEANAGHPTSDPAAIALTPKGIAQANALAALVPFKPDIIIMTPYIRTQQTARPLIEKYPEVPVEIWPLHEFDFLSPVQCVGTTPEERWPWVQEYWYRCNPYYSDGPGAESFNSFKARVIAQIRRLESVDAKFILVFTHGHVLRATWQYFLGGEHHSPVERMHHFYHHMGLLPMPNTCIFKARYQDGWQIETPEFDMLSV
jgi:broad specificity phosphatase PhoE